MMAITNRIEGLYYHADPQTNNWVGHWRYNYTYDGSGNRTEEINYHWDLNSDNWINDSRNIITVDVNGNPTQEVHYQWDTQTDNWEHLKKAVHYYSSVTEIPDTTLLPDKESILVYPNPVTDYVTIEMSDSIEITSIEIIDLYGRILRTEDNINSTSVTLQRGDLLPAFTSSGYTLVVMSIPKTYSSGKPENISTTKIPLKHYVSRGFLFVLYPEWDLNPHGHHWPLDFKSSVSTNSTIRAGRHEGVGVRCGCMVMPVENCR